MAKKTKKSPVELPQSADTWYFAVRKLRAWIAPEGEEPVRPFVRVTVNMDSGTILYIQTGEGPGVEEAQETLFSAMLQPQESKAKPERPARIYFEDRELMQALTPALKEIGIETRYRPNEGMDELVKDLEAHLSGGRPEVPGLLSQRKVTAKLVASLFAAAAGFYRAAPWVELRNEDVLAITVPPQKEPSYVIVMGQGGVEYGLALYLRWEDVEQQYLPYDDPEEIIPPGGLHALHFNPVTEVPFDDLEAIEKYGWEVADPSAYPVPLVFIPPDTVQRPERDGLLWYEAALRAIPVFVRENLRRDAGGEIQPVEASIPVTLATGPLSVRIQYPAGDLPQARQPGFPVEAAELDEMPFPFDRRAMEGDMARMFGMFSEQEFDPKLEKAQGLMYEAWEERNPAKRIALARRALKTSKDCADAYVLLAEEAADTLQEALKFYQQGVAAGERALGKEYFEENTGHFWGLLETRPYMRALEGMASCLWQMGRKEETRQIYQEMLRLNPGDNQGVRYVLADLLLSLEREDELDKLLEEYENDWTSVWLYTRALLAFRQSGASQKAKRALQSALEQNRFVPDYLTGKKRVPVRLPDYISLGDDTEAAAYAANHLNYWRKTQGAVEWLQDNFSSLAKAKSPKKAAAGKGKRTRRGKSGPQPGDSVTVKPGVSDPDFGTDLSGWQGRVIEVIEGDEGPAVLIEWDSQTLENMPAELIEKCEEEGLDWAQMHLPVEQVSRAEARDRPEEREAVFEALSRRYAWAYLGEEGRRIQAVLSGVDPDDELAEFEAWETFLRQRLKFPFEAEVSEFQESGPLQSGDRVKVTGLEEVDDLYGVLVRVEKKGFRGTFPLCDLEVTNEASDNYQPVDDYAVWFANR